MSKFCPSCGEELVDSAKFCKSCGKNLEDPKFNPHENPQLKDEQVKLQTTKKAIPLQSYWDMSLQFSYHFWEL